MTDLLFWDSLSFHSLHCPHSKTSFKLILGFWFWGLLQVFLSQEFSLISAYLIWYSLGCVFYQISGTWGKLLWMGNMFSHFTIFSLAILIWSASISNIWSGLIWTQFDMSKVYIELTIYKRPTIVVVRDGGW